VWIAFSAAEGALYALLEEEARLTALVNDVRKQHHLSPLAGSEALAAVARAHAEDMARAGYFDHVDPEGRSPLDRVQAAGIEGFSLLAENIGASSRRGDRLQSIVDNWMTSPVHRENLLNPAFNTTGSAVVQAADGRTLTVQLYLTVRRK
jgi:uncharacterized protein YkwD